MADSSGGERLAVLRGLGGAADDRRVNPGGEIIGSGHPLGICRADIAGTAARKLHARGIGRLAIPLDALQVSETLAAHDAAIIDRTCDAGNRTGEGLIAASTGFRPIG